MDLSQRPPPRRPLRQRSRRHRLYSRLVSPQLTLPFRFVQTQDRVSCINLPSLGGEVVAPEVLGSSKFDLPAFIGRNSKEIRFPEIETCIKSLKQEQGFKKLGVIGFCWGGWAAFQLGAKGMYIRTDRAQISTPRCAAQKND